MKLSKLIIFILIIFEIVSQLYSDEIIMAESKAPILKKSESNKSFFSVPRIAKEKEDKVLPLKTSSTQSIIIDWEEEGEKKEKGLVPLTKEEELCSDYDEGTLFIFKKSGSTKELIITIKNTDMDYPQLSLDKKSLLYCETYGENSLYPYFFLDGNKGKITYLGNYKKDGIRLDERGKYVLYKKDVLNVYYLKDLKQNTEKKIVWPIKALDNWNKENLSSSVYRASDNEQADYMVRIITDRLLIAKAYYDIEKDLLIPLIDDSDKDKEDLLPKDALSVEYYGY